MLGIINWKTTASGVAAIFGALADLAHAYGTGTMPHFEADFTALSIGIGLICAKDQNVTGGSVSNVDGATRADPVSIISPNGVSKV